MEQTSHTLLQQIDSGSPQAWRRLDALYRPFILGFFRSQQTPPEDAEDLTQEVMAVIFREIQEFRHTGRTGAFRTWIRNIAIFRLRGYRRWRSVRGSEIGGAAPEILEACSDADQDLEEHWDQQHDRYILQQLLQSLEGRFNANTLTAFRRVTLESVAAAEVAKELQMTVSAVYIAKSRVMRQLRQEAEGLVDDVRFA